MGEINEQNGDKDIEPTKIGDNRQPNGTFGPNNIANPNGRPKGSVSITEKLKQELEKVPEGQKKNYLEMLITKILKKGIVDEDSLMIKTIWAYIDGMPTQPIQHSGEIEQTVKIDESVRQLVEEFINWRKKKV